MARTRRRMARWALVGAVLHLSCTSVDSSPEGSELANWSIDSVPEFEVGGMDDRPEYTLYEVVGVTRLSDGRIVVANRGTSQLRFYDRNGTHLFDAAGEGDGPGELRFTYGMARGFADSLIVVSRDPGITFYDSEGRYARSERHDMISVPNHPCRFGEGAMWMPTPEGVLLRLLVDNFSPTWCPERPEGPFRLTGLLGIPSPGGGRFDTITIMPATERLGIRYRVFGHDLLIGIDSGIVYAGDTDSGSIVALSLGGDTLAVLPTPFGSRPVPDQLKIESVVEVPQRDGTTRFLPGYRGYPEEFPRYGRILVDQGGFLWVMQYPIPPQPFFSYQLARPDGRAVPAEGAFWRVLDPSGSVVAELKTPGGFFPMEIGSDYMLGLTHDEFDVETVRLYRLRR